MNTRYIVPAAAMAIVLILLGYFSLSVGGELRQERDDLAVNLGALRQANNSSTMLNLSLLRVKQTASPANTFMAHWHDLLMGALDSNGILTDMSKAATTETVAVQGRKSGTVDYLWSGKPVQVQFAECIGVSSEFYRELNWLGDIEKDWPVARCEQVDFRQKGSSLQLLVRMTLPTFIAVSAK